MIEYFTWENWMYFGILLMIIEIFTPGFVAACIGIGAFAASLVAGLGGGIVVQLLAFSIVCLLAFLYARPFFLKYLYSGTKQVNTNADSLIGRTCLVYETINNDVNAGRVKVDGDIFIARSADRSLIPQGTMVEIVEKDSTVLIVKAIH